MMIGGRTDHFEFLERFTGESWYFDHATRKFTTGPTLKKARKGHAAGIVTDHDTGEKIMVVSGGPLWTIINPQFLVN